jgi:hypothetical protein
VIGAICGALYSYSVIRRPSGRPLARIGAQLPAPARVAETTDARRMLEATAGHQLPVASVAPSAPT